MPALVSFALSVTILAAKVLAWRLTGSMAILADALESIVNVVAAGFALFALRISSIPADSDHPYGHGKIELISAAFEGGLVFAASMWILLAASRSIMEPPALHQLDEGLLVSLAAGLVNLGLGLWLVRKGRELQSLALTADGRHVLSDVWTTAGAMIGLMVVMLTGYERLDGIVAFALGLLLARTGIHLVREALDGLMDREDPELLSRLRTAFASLHIEGVHSLHRLRAIRSGDHVHVDAHVCVPADWSVEHAHHVVENVEKHLKERAGIKGDVVLHLDPHAAPGRLPAKETP